MFCGNCHRRIGKSQQQAPFDTITIRVTRQKWMLSFIKSQDCAYEWPHPGLSFQATLAGLFCCQFSEPELNGNISICSFSFHFCHACCNNGGGVGWDLWEEQEQQLLWRSPGQQRALLCIPRFEISLLIGS